MYVIQDIHHSQRPKKRTAFTDRRDKDILYHIVESEKVWWNSLWDKNTGPEGEDTQACVRVYMAYCFPL